MALMQRWWVVPRLHKANFSWVGSASLGDNPKNYRSDRTYELSNYSNS
jgi:hypothetical protein